MENVISWILALFLIVIPTVIIFRIARRVGLWRQVLAAAFLFVSIGILGKAFLGLAGDEIAYFSESIGILEQWQGGDAYEPSQPWTKLLFSYLLAVLYYLTGPNIYLGILLLTPFFCALPLLAGQVSFNFFGQTELRTFTGWIAVFLPQTAMWSPWLLREVLSFFLLGLGVFAASLLYRNLIPISTLIFALSIVFMMFVRFPLIWVLISLFLATSFTLLWRSWFNLKSFAAIALSTIAVVGVFFVTQLTTKSVAGTVVSSESMVVNTELREIIVGSNSSETEALAYKVTPEQQPGIASTTEQQSGIASTAKYTIQNLLPSLIGPFPWQWKGLNFAIAGLDGLLMMFLIALALAPIFIRRIGGRTVALILWAGVTPLILANSLAMANYGIAMRVRANVALVLLPIVAYSIFMILKSFRKESMRNKLKSDSSF